MKSNPQGNYIKRNPAQPMNNVRLIVDKLIPEWKNEASDFAKQFQFDKSKSVKDLCKSIWNFCRKNFKYKLDPDGVELIRSPKRTLADSKKGVDCEDFTVLLSCALLILKVYHKVRVVNYGTGWQHIYLVVGSENIILDPVMDVFNYEDPYVMKADFVMINIGLGGNKSTYTYSNDIIDIPNNLSSSQRKSLNTILIDNPEKLVVVYHASSKKNNIRSKGILAVNKNNSSDSEFGYSYYSKCPDIAISYARKKYPNDEIALYEIVLPVSKIEPDKNNLKKVNGFTLADSITQRACSVQVKGDLPSYLVTEIGLSGTAYHPEGFVEIVRDLISGSGLKRNDFEKKHINLG